jgi:hypothetical protein
MAAVARPNTAERFNQLADVAPRNTVGAAARLLGAVAESHGKAAFAARALDALTDLAERLDEATLTDAAGAPSNLAALVQALDRPEVLAEIRRDDPLGPARVRGVRAQEWLLRQHGGTLTAGQMAEALGITRQAVDKRRKQGTLIGLDLGRRGYAYPAWQVGSMGTLPGLPAVLAELSDESDWGKAAFFLTSNVWLDGETPLALLQRGETALVVNAASALGDQVAV